MKEGKVIYLQDHITGYKNFLHENGWERGFKDKGLWNGEYESMGTICDNAAYYYTKGIFKKGIQCGKWLTFFVWFDGRLPPRAIAGEYKDGKKHGSWSIYRYGSDKKEVTYNNGVVIKQEILDEGDR